VADFVPFVAFLENVKSFQPTYNLVDHLLIAVCLLQLGGCDPDLPVRRDVFSCLQNNNNQGLQRDVVYLR
jgi:hypothetical protein